MLRTARFGFLIDALYLNSYRVHGFFEPQGLDQAVNWNIVVLHIDLFRVARKSRFHKIEEEAKGHMTRFIDVLRQASRDQTIEPEEQDRRRQGDRRSSPARREVAGFFLNIYSRLR